MNDVFIREDLGSTYSLGIDVTNLKEEVVKFDFTRGIDQNLDALLSKLENCNKIFIEACLSPEIESVTGIRLAHHIRLSKDPNLESKMIYIVSELSVEYLCKLNTLSYLLFCKGVSLIGISDVKSITKNDEIINENSEDIIADYIEKTKIDPPAFYDNRHSIANEWAINLLNNCSFTNDNQLNLRNKVFLASLFVKARMKNRSLVANSNFAIEQVHSKILLIEDKYEQGWLEYYTRILPNSSFDYLRIDKNSSQEYILELFEELNLDLYDIFILDIRLVESDHDSTVDYLDYTGLKILEKLYENNEGNQVLLVSASNKFELYESARGLFKAKLEIFVKPDIESEFDSYWLDSSVRQPLLKLNANKWKKELFNVVQSSLKEIKILNTADDNIVQFKDSLILQIELAWSVIKHLNNENENELAIVYLSFFKIYEIIGSYIILGEGNGVHVRVFNVDYVQYDTNRGRVYINTNRRQYPSIVNKIGFLMKDILGRSNRNINEFEQLKEIRRKWVHPNLNNGEVKGIIELSDVKNISKHSLQFLKEFIIEFEK